MTNDVRNDDVHRRLAEAEAALDASRAREAGLRESEERYRSLFKRMGQGYCELNLLRDETGSAVDLVYNTLSPAFEHLFDIPVRDAIGRTASEIFPGLEPWWSDTFGKIAEQGEPVRVEHDMASLGRSFEVHVYPTDRNHVTAIYEDVTERRQMSDALRRNEERQGYLLKLSDILQRLRRADDIKAAAMRLLGEHLGVSRAQYHECDSSGEYYDADGIGYAVGLPLLTDKYRIDQFGTFVGEDFAAGRPFRSDDLFVDPRPTAKEREAYQTYDIRAGAGIPLLRGGKLVAILALHDSHPHPWTDTELELMRETAERTWTAVERVRTEATLRGREERQAVLLKLADTLRSIVDPATIRIQAMELLGEHLGVALARYDEAAQGAGVARSGEGLPVDQWQSDDLGRFVKDAFGAGEAVAIRDVATDWRVSGAKHAFPRALGFGAFLGVPVVKGGRWVGAIELFDGAARDWTTEAIALVEDVAERTWAAIGRARAEAARRESEARFAQFAASSSDALWIRDAGTLSMEFVSPAIQNIYGVRPEAVVGDPKRWAAIIVPEDRDAALAHLERARAGEAVTHEFRILRASDGTFRWIRTTDFPLRDEQGFVQRIGGIAQDVTEAKQAAEHQGVLLHELQHRVRNILAMIRSMADQTGDTADDVEDYRDLLDGRLRALARVQVLLTRAANAGVDLATLIRAEVEAQAAHEGRWSLDGPELVLSPKAAEVLTLAIHELATNALKYGAFSHAAGRLAVTWRVFYPAEEPWLGLDWVESGAPAPLSLPQRQGFGTLLIEQRIPYELQGRGRVAVTPEGARCRLEFPLRRGDSILETDGVTLSMTIAGGSLDMAGEAELNGCRVLVVEDDYFLAKDTSRAIFKAGGDVLGPVGQEEQALALIATEAPTCALVDINLGEGAQFKVAGALQDHGVPFVFVTGYDDIMIPARFDAVERIRKPADFRQVVRVAARLCAV